MAHASVVMLMSVDISGSTAFKTTVVDDQGSPKWIDAFAAFFAELPLHLMGQVAAHSAHRSDVPDFSVWKVMGDEILFIAKPRDIDEARLFVAALRQATLDFDRSLAERWPLHVRSAAWGAAIGSRNRAIEIPEMPGQRDGSPYLDYLGPDIDIGFRLSGHARAGELIIAPLLAESLCARPNPEIELHAVGAESLKGVAQGRPVPLILATKASEGGRTRPGAMTGGGASPSLLAQLRRWREEAAAWSPLSAPGPLPLE
ncbi:MAG: hypothetical protein KDA24_12295 [Deltaproteobacteria bacterium]|nr:hypothetical protein [Deltaproteobacteria bacterium]